MKILYAGNLANVGYYHVRNFRRHNFQIDLVMEKNPPPASDPFLRNKELTEYPNWIKFYDKNSSSWKFELLKIMRDKKYDLIHAHVEFPIFAYASRRPFISQIMGSDLREMAFTNSLRGVLLRRAYRKSKLVLYSIPGDFERLSKLKVERKIFLPILFDIFDFFKSQKTTITKFTSDFILFHPPSHIWDVKGNDILIRGFNKFLKNNPKALLITVNIGRDSQKSKELVKSLGIENNVYFLERLNSSELLNYYNLADVVADQFILNGIGGIGMETFCCAKPLLTSCSPDCYLNMHPEPPPAVNAKTVDEICDQLELLKDPNIRKKYSMRGRNWLEKYQSPDTIHKQLVIIYESILNGEDVYEISKKIKKILN